MIGLSPHQLRSLVTRMTEDPVRREKRARVRVWPYGKNSFLCGHKLELGDDGSCEIVVYESEIGDIELNTEDKPDVLKAAKEAHEREVSEWEAKMKAAGHNLDDVPPLNSSVEAHTHRLLGRTRRKLRKFEVVERGLPPPEAPDQSGQRELVEAIVEAMGRVFGPVIEQASRPKRGRPPKQDTVES